MQDHDEPYVTRKQAVELVRSQLGVPLALSTLEKKVAGGPPVAARYGRQLLYRPEDVLAWARSLITPTKMEVA